MLHAPFAAIYVCLPTEVHFSGPSVAIRLCADVLGSTARDIAITVTRTAPDPGNLLILEPRQVMPVDREMCYSSSQKKFPFCIRSMDVDR